MKRPPTPRRGPTHGIGMPPRGAQATARPSLDWDPVGEAYYFVAERSQYRVAVPEPHSGILTVEARLEEQPWQPLFAFGMLFREPDGTVLGPVAAHEHCPLVELKHQAGDSTLRMEYLERHGDQAVRREVELRAVGHSLEIQFRAPAGEATGFCGVAPVERELPGVRQLIVPGLPEPLLVQEPGAFAAGYWDRYRGQASAYPSGGALYRPSTDGRWGPIEETFHLTVSEDPLDPLPQLQRPAAPYRPALLGRVVLDLFSEAPYREDAELVRRLVRYGLRDVLLVYRNWQQYGYLRRGPLLYPADPARGTNAEFQALVAAAEEAGWMVALREEYATIAPDSPYWDEKALALWMDGEPRRTRSGQGAIAAHRMIEFARLEATKIQRNYRPTATFVDGHTAWNPEEGLRQVDATPGSAAGSESAAIRCTESLLHFLRDVHDGPVIGAAGEGPARFDTLAEGMAEAALRGPEGGAAAPLLVDYELREVRPKLVGIGAGSYRQFAARGGEQGVDARRVDWDAYRATEIALGHAGYVGNYRLSAGSRGASFPGGSLANAVREYFLLRALQELYLDAPVRSAEYWVEGEFVSLAGALARGLTLEEPRLRIAFAPDLILWVNRSAEEWPVSTEEGDWLLPPSGFLAMAPRQRLLAFSTLVDGSRLDYCRCAAYTFLDSRGEEPRSFERMTTDGAAVLLKSEVSGRQDVVLVNATRVVAGDEEYALSERGDLRIEHLSAREVELSVLSTESGRYANVTWPAPAGGRPGRVQVTEWEDGRWVPGRVALQVSRETFQLPRARPGERYRIALAGG